MNALGLLMIVAGAAMMLVGDDDFFAPAIALTLLGVAVVAIW